LSAVPRLRPVTLREAKAAITRWHRHHHPRRGLRWAVGAELDDRLVGVAVVGNPSAPTFQRDPRILEVTRVAIDPAAAPPLNIASRLYGACWRAAKALGCTRLVTYTRLDEPGTSLRAASWVPTAITPTAPNDPGGNRALRYLPGLNLSHTTEQIPRIRWEPASYASPSPEALQTLHTAHPASWPTP